MTRLNLANVAKVMYQAPGVEWFELHERHSMVPFIGKRGIAGASNEMGVRITHDFRVILSDGKHTQDERGEKPLQLIDACCKKLGIKMPKVLKDRLDEPDLMGDNEN